MDTRANSREEGLPRKNNLYLISNPTWDYGTQFFGRIISQKTIKNTVVHNILKVAWARYRSVKMVEVDDKTMTFEFHNERDRDQIMDLSPWSVQGHRLNLKVCKANTCVE